MSDSMQQHVPLNLLFRSKLNVRRSNRETPVYRKGIEVLAASIISTYRRTGKILLQNLVVHVQENGYGVAAGGRRHDSLDLLASIGDIAPDMMIPVIEVDVENVTSVSLTENVQRQAMHPVDEYEAYLDLTLQGWTIDQIADAFGVTPLVVERRLKLRAAAPELLEQFREDELTTDQLIALCSTDDHALQVEVWNRAKGQHWNSAPTSLRRAVMQNEVEAGTDRRVEFIGGVAAYEQAGGRVRRDLFASEGQGVILEDSSLLEALVSDKLQAYVDQIEAEGWGWVEVWREMNWTAHGRLGTFNPRDVELSTADSHRLSALATERDELSRQIRELDDQYDNLTEQEIARLDALQDQHSDLDDQVDEFEASKRVFDPEAMKHAGVLIRYDQGSLRIERGLVRTADRVAIAEVLGDTQRVIGGRETESAGRKADAFSDALRRSLLGHRNLAAQVTTAANVKVAKVLFVSQLVASLRVEYGTVPCDFSITSGYGSRTNCPISDASGKQAEEQFRDLGQQLIAELPAGCDAVWDALMNTSDQQLDVMLAYSIARSVSLAEESRGLTPKLVEALGLDMADHFTPTAENFLGRIPKDLVVEALEEAQVINVDEERESLLAMKKSALAKEAEIRLAGSGWIPEMLRLEKPRIIKKGSSRKPGKKEADAA